MRTTFRNIMLAIFFSLFSLQSIYAQLELQRENIANIIETANGKIGVAVIDVNIKDTLTFNGDAHFPMQSVYKFPLALAVLDEVDRGKLALNQNIHITKKDLLPNTWSPLREKYPNGNVDIPLSEVITNTVALSDNNGCDILFRLIGGTETANKFVANLGINGISIVATEEEMAKDWAVQYRNYSTPKAMAELLLKFADGKILSKESHNYLWNVMVNTVTGTGRIKGNLPKGTKVAHKTGSSGVKDGIAAATNDIGIVELPDGKQFVIVVYVSDSSDNKEKRDKIIADITRVVWDSYTIK